MHANVLSEGTTVPWYEEYDYADCTYITCYVCLSVSLSCNCLVMYDHLYKQLVLSAFVV